MSLYFAILYAKRLYCTQSGPFMPWNARETEEGESDMEILRCENVRKVYGSGDNQVVALNHINLSVQKGEFVAIVGASGSGKSTLLHILGSVDQPIAYLGKCGSADRRESPDRGDRTICHEPDAGSHLPAQKGRAGLSVL